MALFEAIAAGDADRVKAILAADPTASGRRNDEGLSAVLAARYRHRHEILHALLATQPELDVFDAAAVGDTDRLRQLLDADPSQANAYAADGFFPLGLAAHFRQPEAMALLLERGADVHAASRNPMHVQSLHAAVAGRNTKGVRILLEAGADPNVEQHGGWTALMAAAAHGDEEQVDLLLAHGAEPTPSAVDQATQNGHPALSQRIQHASGNRSTTS